LRTKISFTRGTRVLGLLCIVGLLAEIPRLQAQSNSSGVVEDLPDAPLAQTATQTATMESSSSLSTTDERVTLKGLPRQFVMDEAHIFTSPFRLRKRDLKWLLPLGAATAVALSTDSYTMRNVVSKDRSFNNAANVTSDVLRGTAIGVPVLMWVAGSATHDEHSRETGLVGGEAVLDAYAFDEVAKYAFLRERPLIDNANGKFFTTSSLPDPSFISGHAITTWSSAAVLAEEYHRPWQQIGIYTFASGVSLTRVLGQDHFPTDVLLGSAAGWLIGHYVYKEHHRSRHRSEQ